MIRRVSISLTSEVGALGSSSTCRCLQHTGSHTGSTAGGSEWRWAQPCSLQCLVTWPHCSLPRHRPATLPHAWQRAASLPAGEFSRFSIQREHRQECQHTLGHWSHCNPSICLCCWKWTWLGPRPAPAPLLSQQEPTLHPWVRTAGSRACTSSTAWHLPRHRLLMFMVRAPARASRDAGSEPKGDTFGELLASLRELEKKKSPQALSAQQLWQTFSDGIMNGVNCKKELYACCKQQREANISDVKPGQATVVSVVNLSLSFTQFP